jgi:phenylpropionate dioxygenase-like ring-hydroxylating dioxygenase large terminal subunit
MIINQWYVAEESSAVLINGHKRVKLCGLDFVLFRNARGEVFCLSDVCIHRGASLGGGQVVEGAIECPYHGWRFDGGGACVRIPSLGKDAKIPARAKVDSYPVHELYGWIWVFLGDAPAAERPGFPDFPEWDQQGKGWRCIRGEYLWHANYARIVENGIDPSHAAFVHPAFGDRKKPEIHDFAVEADEHSAFAQVTFLPPDSTGLWKIGRPKRAPVTVRNGFHVSGAHVRIEINITATWRIVIYDVNTPIDETTTLTRWIMARNFMTLPMFDADSRRRTISIFDQDSKIMESVAPELLPVYLHEEVSVKSDVIMVAWRNKRRELIEKGWALDVDALARERASKRAFVIPSPGRAPDAPGASDYLLKTTPLIDGATARAEALAQRHQPSREAAE